MQMKRARATDCTNCYNPVYPFTGGSIFPPFITPCSGLSVGGLSVRTAAPLTIEQNAVTLKYGDGLQVTEDGELISSPNAMNAQLPLYNDGNTFALLYKDPLTLDDGALTVRSLFTANPPISIDNGVISVGVGQGIAVRDGELTVTPVPPLILMGNNDYIGLSIGSGLNSSNSTLNLNMPTAPLSLSASGSLLLQYNASNFRVVDNQLSLRLSDITVSPPLTLTNQHISLSTGKGLQVSENVLQTNVNENDFYYDSSSPPQLCLQPKLISYRSGDVSLTTYDVTVVCPEDLTTKVAACVQMVWLNGLVQGTLQVKGVSDSWPKGSGSYYTSSIPQGIRFGLVVAPLGGADNVSGFPTATLIPSGSNISYFQPAGFPSFSFTAGRYYLPLQLGNFVQVAFMSGGNPQLKFFDNGTTRMYYTVCQRENTSANKIIYFSFIITQQTDGQNFFDTSQSGLYFTTPPLPFSYTADTAFISLQ
ncbi:fiber [Psittacine adenovirus 3]|uniref:Fiber n=1 Tax=Psittacine adenovirus 3 TaxID=1580497 RepID=A0A5C0PZ40_9ADEN|nr:fiber [Psittacine adenovirus 3]